MIVRGPRPSDNFAQIHNAALADGRLSFKARGILAFLLSRPPGWKTSAERLAKSGIDGERAVKSGLKELEATGYLKRTRTHAENGQWIHNQVITDQPELVPMGTKRTDGSDPDVELETIGTFCTGGKQPDINNTDSNNTYLQEADVVVSPTEGEPTTTSSRTSYGDTRDVDGSQGVGAPTPLRGPRRWSPSENALRTAKDNVELQDIPLSITHYVIRMAEMKKEPSSSEWLRWLIADEKKLQAEEREKAKSNGEKKKWFAVAGD